MSNHLTLELMIQRAILPIAYKLFGMPQRTQGGNDTCDGAAGLVFPVAGDFMMTSRLLPYAVQETSTQASKVTFPRCAVLWYSFNPTVLSN